MMTKESREAIRIRLGEIELANGGRLTPADVVEDAKNPESPLHACFEWDVERAAAAYWIEQARTLITSIRVVTRVDKTAVTSVFYVRDPSAANGEQGYVSVETLRGESDMAREAIVAECSRVADMLRRVRELAVALDAAKDVESIIQSVVGLRNRFKDPPAQQQ